MEELLEVLAIALNMDVAEVAEAAKSDGGKETLLDYHKKRVSELKKTNFDDGFKKAEKKVKSELEREVKEKFGVASDKQGIELLEEIITSKLPKEGEKSKKLTEEDVKLHPLFLAKEKEIDTLKTQFEQEKTSVVESLKKEWNREKVLTQVKEKAKRDLLSANPLLPSDPAKADYQIEKLYLKELENFDFDIVGDDIIPLDKEGKRIEDAHGRVPKFQDFTKGIYSKIFDFKVADDRSSPNGKDKAGDTTQQNTFKGTVPKTRKEYEATITNRDIPLAERTALSKMVETKELVLTD